MSHHRKPLADSKNRFNIFELGMGRGQTLLLKKDKGQGTFQPQIGLRTNTQYDELSLCVGESCEWHQVKAGKGERMEHVWDEK